jgi:hypothetical protein
VVTGLSRAQAVPVQVSLPSAVGGPVKHIGPGTPPELPPVSVQEHSIETALDDRQR